ncbi:NADH-dependent alcohol dehydrogenase [Parazoarcus communis]|uniref:NADH-dependent alcohol dehydrogenase n=1 Tax=Parazoarcus communis TaxID=41977 RepID=A0A2U8GMJ7_9RHOO|nr:iron-containing alcohol dehydrogenase [Parazoarcus communis]AWI74186.1 NADH-dependent alcohol dehydrogenase [Parazoarcus communis]|tara:strand:- start:36446 stop:37603 length:1158 start_codon:yes stop_codon:yes gene_type:complete
MQNFEFYNPTKIVFGTETISRLAELVPSDARVLILYGGSSAQKNGTLDEVKSALGARTVREFGGIEPNPTYETLMRAVEQIRSEKLDFLLAVGGGSVIDGTKFVATAVNFNGDPWEILLTHGQNVEGALPFGSVLTLPATGSEMNCGAVITRSETQTKLAFLSPHVFPRFSVLDPSKTYTLPRRQIANGVVDAFVHTVEQYLTYPVGGMVQDRFAEGLLQTLIEIGPKALETPEDADVRANLMWVATMALNGLIGAGVPQDWATHMIGHELTAAHGIDHARTLAIVLPSLLNVQREQKRDKLLQYAARVWQIDSGTEDQRIDEAIRRTAQFFESLGVKTRLADYELGTEAIDNIVAQLEVHGMTKLGEHKDITPAVSRTILEGAR